MNVYAKIFKNSKGKPAVWQTPNVPLMGWALFSIIAHFLSDGKWQSLADYISFGFIFAWAWLEITQGSSYFRRILGAIVLVASLHARIS